MKRRLILIFAICVSTSSLAQKIADCTNPDGFAYYHHSKLVPKKDSGFQKDKITGGLTSIVKLPNGEFDILIVDVRKKIISMTQDGGRVVLLRRGSKDASFLHYHPGSVIEIYTLWVDADGKAKFDLLQSKGGDDMLIHKSSVMVGECSTINFDLIGN